MVDVCLLFGLKFFYGLFGDFSDLVVCENQFWNVFLMGCFGVWFLYLMQIDIVKIVFFFDFVEVVFVKKILDVMLDGIGVVMIDGKMQDDVIWKQVKVIVDLVWLVVIKDVQFVEIYGFQIFVRVFVYGRMLECLYVGGLCVILLMFEFGEWEIMCIVKFNIGQVVWYWIYFFRGVIFDVDLIFSNMEDWWNLIFEDVCLWWD